MSRHKKGRKHRTVNRTPRPVGPARPSAGRAKPPPAARAGRAASAGKTAPTGEEVPAAERAPTDEEAPAARPPEAGPARARTTTGTATANRGSAPAGATPAGAVENEADGPLFSTTARDGGLGQHAARTWEQLKSMGTAGATVDDLCRTVGYQAPTILKHLKGLARYGMAEQREDRWAPTGKSQWEAAFEHGLTERPSPAARAVAQV